MADTTITPIKHFYVAENETLKKVVRQLEKEADWLASKLSKYMECPRHKDKGLCFDRSLECKTCWHEAARKAVSHDE